MALVRYTQGAYFNPAAKTLDLRALYPSIEFWRIKQIRRDNSNTTLYKPGDATATASFSNGVVTFTGVDTSKMLPGDPVSILYDEVDNDSPFGVATVVTAGATFTAGRALWFVATAAGSITMTLAGGGTVTVPIVAGLNTFPVAATGFALVGGAAGTAYNMA